MLRLYIIVRLFHFLFFKEVLYTNLIQNSYMEGSKLE